MPTPALSIQRSAAALALSIASLATAQPGGSLSSSDVSSPGGNPRTVCAADCDENGLVNTLDFLCFLNYITTGDIRADCDGNGTLNTLDFLCYLNHFNDGCPPSVKSVLPDPERIDVPRDAQVQIHFSAPIDPDSVTAQSIHIYGRWSGPVQGQYELSPDQHTVTFTRDRPFSAGEAVFVNISTDIRNTQNQPLESPYAFSFWAQPDPGTWNFVHTSTLGAGITPYGAHGGDLDNDGDLDLAVPNENSEDVSVLLNLGNDTFSAPVNYPAGEHCSPSEGLDLNGDLIVDLAIANILDSNVSILIGRGDGTFEPQAQYPVGAQPRGLTALDVDGDGDFDLVTANRNSSNLSLLLNRGDGTFEPAIPIEAGVNGETGVMAAHVDGDGLMDLIVIGYHSNQIVALINNGASGFIPGTPAATQSRPWMVVTGDVNGDGLVDAAVANSQSNSASIHIGTGGGFSLLGSYPAGSFPIAVDLGDIDGDGDLDMTASAFSSGTFTLYRNDGTGNYTQVTALSTPGAGSCTVLHDRDGDGDVDITGIDEIADLVPLFQQQ